MQKVVQNGNHYGVVIDGHFLVARDIKSLCEQVELLNRMTDSVVDVFIPCVRESQCNNSFSVRISQFRNCPKEVQFLVEESLIDRDLVYYTDVLGLEAAGDLLLLMTFVGDSFRQKLEAVEEESDIW